MFEGCSVRFAMPAVAVVFLYLLSVGCCSPLSLPTISHSKLSVLFSSLLFSSLFHHRWAKVTNANRGAETGCLFLVTNVGPACVCVCVWRFVVRVIV